MSWKSAPYFSAWSDRDSLTLTLLEAGVLLIDYEQLAFATHDLTIRATLLDGCPDFHIVLF
jgi:hypothetical protein